MQPYKCASLIRKAAVGHWVVECICLDLKSSILCKLHSIVVQSLQNLLSFVTFVIIVYVNIAEFDTTEFIKYILMLLRDKVWY